MQVHWLEGRHTGSGTGTRTANKAVKADLLAQYKVLDDKNRTGTEPEQNWNRTTRIELEQNWNITGIELEPERNQKWNRNGTRTELEFWFWKEKLFLHIMNLVHRVGLRVMNKISKIHIENIFESQWTDIKNCSGTDSKL